MDEFLSIDLLKKCLFVLFFGKPRQKRIIKFPQEMRPKNTSASLGPLGFAIQFAMEGLHLF